MKVITDKNINYPFAAAIWVATSLGLYFMCSLVGIEGKFWTLCSFISGAIIAFGDRNQVPIQTNKLLLFNGEEVKDDAGESVWVKPGMYFTFWIFTLAPGEVQDMEIQDCIVPPFNCQCKDKGITIEANGDWKIVDHDKFKKQKADKMEDNLISLIRRTLIRVCGPRLYTTQILGTNLGDLVIAETNFKKQCAMYGVEFENMIADAFPSDLKQENLNSYSDELFKTEKAKYGVNHNLTRDEIKEINEIIQVKLGQAKKIITNSPVINRNDIT